jgi:hypothetical protein
VSGPFGTVRPPVPGPPAAGVNAGGGVIGDGSARIDEALDALAGVRDAVPAEQVGPLSQAQRVLRETLDSIGDV